VKTVPPSAILELIKTNFNLNYEQLTEDDEQWKKYHEFITFNSEPGTLPQHFIKVPFKEALSLVGSKQVFINKGTAFVPLKNVSSIAASHFKAKLAQELAKANKFIPQILKD
jgi:DNA primase large subunit